MLFYRNVDFSDSAVMPFYRNVDFSDSAVMLFYRYLALNGVVLAMPT